MGERTIWERMRLDGRVAWVTGGARGIGLSVATALAEAGADVALVDIDVATARVEAEALAAATGRKVLAFEADVTSAASVDAMCEAVMAAFGRLDIAVNNAGICVNVPFLEMSLADWQRVVDINLTGVFLTGQAAARAMVAAGRGGSIVNTASMSAHIVNVPQPQCAYNASKAGVIQLTKSMAVELVGHGVRVNSISPGYIGTKLTLESEALKDLIPQWKAASPMKRLGDPAELQAMVLYLAGDAASFSTGTDYVVDGGFTAV